MLIKRLALPFAIAVAFWVVVTIPVLYATGHLS